MNDLAYSTLKNDIGITDEFSRHFSSKNRTVIVNSWDISSIGRKGKSSERERATGNINSVFGEGYVNVETVPEVFTFVKFKTGNFSLEDEPRRGLGNTPSAGYNVFRDVAENIIRDTRINTH